MNFDRVSPKSLRVIIGPSSPAWRYHENHRIIPAGSRRTHITTATIRNHLNSSFDPKRGGTKENHSVLHHDSPIRRNIRQSGKTNQPGSSMCEHGAGGASVESASVPTAPLLIATEPPESSFIRLVPESVVNASQRARPPSLCFSSGTDRFPARARRVFRNEVSAFQRNRAKQSPR